MAYLIYANFEHGTFYIIALFIFFHIDDYFTNDTNTKVTFEKIHAVKNNNETKYEQLERKLQRLESLEERFDELSRQVNGSK